MQAKNSQKNASNCCICYKKYCYICNSVRNITNTKVTFFAIMEIKFTDRGLIDLAHTLASMQVGENWDVALEQFSLSYLRTFCSLAGKVSGKLFAVHRNSDTMSQIVRIS